MCFANIVICWISYFSYRTQTCELTHILTKKILINTSLLNTSTRQININVVAAWSDHLALAETGSKR